MHTNTSWQDVLAQPEAGNHIVQVCQNEAFLVDAVTHFIGAGLQNDDASIVVIATPVHRLAFIASLERQGYSVQSAKGEGKIKFFDAESLLSSFMRNDMPEWEAFEKHVGSLMREVQLKYTDVRAYGEMVDLLWQKNKRDAAIQLEEFWNELSKQLKFSLLCTYTMNSLDPEAYDGSLDRICKCHTHLIPTNNYALLEAAVQEATHDVLGPTLTHTVSELAASWQTTIQMPPAQATLLFLSEKMPLATQKILSRIQDHCAVAATN